VTQEIGELAGAVVAMTRTAMTLLVDEYGVPEAKVSLIPHGVDARTASPRARTSPNPVVLTWGLIGPGKGIEWGIRAMALLGDEDPAPIYKVLGQTHPKVVIDQGERYRESLTALVEELGLVGRVELDGRYCELDELAAEVAAADVVLLPYDSREQATSGVLVEAVAAGKLVIATRFPHSIELLSDGAGFLVDHEHPEQIARAVVVALADRARLQAALVVARAHAHANSWQVVAQRYAALADELASVCVGC
jgi:glycosyltransferase involved in cell wall biosynthesis